MSKSSKEPLLAGDEGVVTGGAPDATRLVVQPALPPLDDDESCNYIGNGKRHSLNVVRNHGTKK